MRVSAIPRPVMLALLAVVMSTAACREEIHSAQWYMAHSTEHQAKLSECKKYPSLNESDQNCKNANAAFAALISARPSQEADHVPK
ncbi:MAG: EexN family lipoprotein [Dokdonella sp.]